MPVTPDSRESRLTRAERLQLAAAALRGLLAGVVREITAWVLQEHIHHIL